MVMVSLPQDWVEQAACREVVTSPATDVFFAPESLLRGPREESAKDTKVREARAKRVCAGCPVVGECLEFARSTGQEHGVWGGLGQAELRALRTARRPSPRVKQAVAVAGRV